MASSSSKPLAIEMVPLSAIKPYWQNPRNNDAAVPAVRASIERYGFQQPIVIDAKGVIIAGHTRYRAAAELGLSEVPCVRTTLSAKKAKEYRIADNKTSELADWDLDALVKELNSFGDTALELAPFFNAGELEDMLKAPGFSPVTAEQIERREAELEGRFTADDTAKKANLVDVLCPHCYKEFTVDRGQLAKQGEVQAEIRAEEEAV